MEQPVSWSSTTKTLEENVVEISFIGSITPDTWHIYDLGPYVNGPNPTSISIDLAGNAELIGEPYITTPVHKAYDNIFKMEIGTCDNGVTISQKVRLLNNNASQIVATVEWQACSEGACLPPDEQAIAINLPAASGTISANTGNDSDSGKGMWSLILSAVLWGFAMLLTPCVFPMVPMTVSFFLKKNSGDGGPSKGKFLATAFGLFIVALYTIPIALIILITWFAGGPAVTADIFNWLATHWLPNIIFFSIFMIFAASFFGAFEITMPSSWVNKSDAKSDKGGLGGVFFLALTLVLVSFSCTGPIVGTVLIESTQGGVWGPIMTMFAFSVAFALPFTVFAFAPSLLKKLPKSGGWLNSVKVVLGFIEVALGFKFLSVADQTYHWGLLDREVYLAIWIVVFTLLGLYLLGKLQFKFDSPLQYVSVFRLALAIGVFSFVVYMIPGMWGAPLKALSGYLPPMHTQDFNLERSSGTNVATYQVSSGDASSYFGFKPKYSEYLPQPEGLNVLFDMEEAIAYAQKVGKPIFLDFTGAGCVNCREMEARVFSNPRVHQLLKDEYVIVQLYGDDKTVLDESEWVTDSRGKSLKSIGKINTNLMNTKYGVNAQPYYVLIDQNSGKTLNTRAYNLDTDAFILFLESGLK
jgi:thiol:disulfide interchange protein DsbD